jgi:hypothetical protein
METPEMEVENSADAAPTYEPEAEHIEADDGDIAEPDHGENEQEFPEESAGGEEAPGDEDDDAKEQAEAGAETAYEGSSQRVLFGPNFK